MVDRKQELFHMHLKVEIKRCTSLNVWNRKSDFTWESSW